MDTPIQEAGENVVDTLHVHYLTGLQGIREVHKQSIASAAIGSRNVECGCV
jgi:hypothetical protein